MIIAQELETQESISQDVIFPPGDLYSDEPPVETELHLEQIMLLIKCLKWLWKDRNDFYAAGNLTIYYSPNQKKSEDSRGPDFFVVLGTERKTRKSWVVWDENGKYPHVIVEILSPSTAKTDREFKKQLYQNIFRTPDYFWFDPYTLEFAGFHLLDGKYQPLTANEKGHLWSQQLGLYLGVYNGLLRYFTREGILVPTPEESAEQEGKRAEAEAKARKSEAERAEAEARRAEAEARRAEAEAKRAEAEAKRAEAEAKRAARLAAKLRELNIDPETI